MRNPTRKLPISLRIAKDDRPNAGRKRSQAQQAMATLESIRAAL
jgi:hypothetical protein